MTKSDQVSLCGCDFVPLLSVMNYCRASFEIVTRIRQMAPLLHIINFRKLRLRVKNETTFISAKNRVDLSSISEVGNYITEWPRYFRPTLYSVVATDAKSCPFYYGFANDNHAYREPQRDQGKAF